MSRPHVFLVCEIMILVFFFLLRHYSEASYILIFRTLNTPKLWEIELTFISKNKVELAGRSDGLFV